MTLLTTQRIIANGLAQLRFEEVWPDLSRIERPTDSTLRGLASPKLMEVRELIGQLVLEFETEAAVKAGDAVRNDIQASLRGKQ